MLTWRVSGTLATVLIVLVFTHEPLVALTVGGLEAVAKMALYFFHERLWDRIKFGRRRVEPVVLWFTGLSGAGKSTLAERLHAHLVSEGYAVELLDGDVIRSIFPSTGFARADRDQHVRRVGFLASVLEKNGVTVVSALISPYRDTRASVRGMCKRFVEIHVDTPLELCERRDVKGLYRRARAGEIKSFTGIDDPYEPPESPEIVVHTDDVSVDASFAELRAQVARYLP
ncbi:MAG: adenylyl-sulfate kinase [Myxococcales bacterium]|nr:adenylyl-sulfate kinase [Myxococcales bacterium]